MALISGCAPPSYQRHSRFSGEWLRKSIALPQIERHSRGTVHCSLFTSSAFSIALPGVVGIQYAHSRNLGQNNVSAPQVLLIAASTGRVSTSSYDRAGNVLTEVIWHGNPNVSRTYTWDAAGRQVQTIDPPAPNSGAGTAYYHSDFDGDGQRIQNRLVHGNDNLSTFEVRSSVLGGAVISTIKKDNNDPNGAQPYEFSAPAIDGTLKWGGWPGFEAADFEWTAPEGLISKGEPLDLRGADVEWSSP